MSSDCGEMTTCFFFKTCSLILFPLTMESSVFLRHRTQDLFERLEYVVSLGRIDSKPRQRGGRRHVSPTNSAVLSLIRLYCQVDQHHRKHHASTEGGEPLEFCVYDFHYLGKKAIETAYSSQVLEGR